jgi:F-type H+-transporting ATPase subunit b
MSFNFSTFLFEVLNFLVLAFVLQRLLYRPLREAIDKRQNEQAKARLEVETARQVAAQQQQQLQAELADLERKRQEVIRGAHEQAEAERQRLLAATEMAAARRQEELHQTADREREDAVQALRTQIVKAAIDMSQGLLRQAANTTLQSQLAQRLIETLETLPDPERLRLRDEWNPVDGIIIESADPLPDATLQQLRDSLTGLTGRPVTISVQLAPDLLCGLRLRSGGQVWDASLAGQFTDKGHSA